MEERQIIRGNAMFCASHDFHLNACVGKNGFPDIHTYREGYHSAVITLLESAKQQPYYIDALIYPILFCARHAVELFLKKQIYVLSDIQAITDCRKSEKLLIANHSLKDLWRDFKKLSTDKRYESYIIELDKYIQYFIEVDDTGQTFRYPINVDGDHHLTEYSCINIGVFSSKYNTMYKIIEELVALTGSLKAEYKQRTFYKDLSRQQILEIAIAIPNRDEWGGKEFDKIKAKFRGQYNMSSNTFSNVLNMIQEHREFASYIGLELPLAELSVNDLRKFIYSFNKHRKRLNTDDFIDVINDFPNEVCECLTKDNIYALSALFDISFFKLYSEEYDADIEKNRNSDDAWGIVFDNISVRRGIVLNYIKDGLRKLGQRTLLTAFD